MQGYIESGEFSYPIGGKKIRLKALFDRDAAAYLHETPVPGTLSLTDHEGDTIFTVIWLGRIKDIKVIVTYISGFIRMHQEVM